MVSCNKTEMPELAGYAGIKCSEDAGDDRYQSLAEAHAGDLDKRIPESVVLSLLDDESDSGIYSADGELVTLPGGGGHTKSEDQEATPAMGQHDTESDCRVFFAGANFNTKMPVLQKLFSQVGTVEDMTLFYMPDGRFRGMGRVLYKNASEASAAVEWLHEREVEGRKLLVKEDMRDVSPLSMASKPIWKAHQDIPVNATSLFGAGGTGRSSAYGNRQRKGFGAKEGSFKGSGTKSGKLQYTGNGKGNTWLKGNRTVFFAGAAFGTTASQLQSVFQRAGKITEFWLFQLADGRSRGMGVVEYQNEPEAQYAVDCLQGFVVQGRELFVKIDDVGALQQHRKSLQQGAFIGQSGDQWNSKEDSFSLDWKWNTSVRGGGGKRSSNGYGNDLQSWTGSSWDHDWVQCPTTPRVFFAGAPFQVSPGRIREEFRNHGEVRSFALFRLADGRHRGMGVCTYESMEVTQQVLNNGVFIDGCPLYLQEDMSQFNTREMDEPETHLAQWDRSSAAWLPKGDHRIEITTGPTQQETAKPKGL